MPESRTKQRTREQIRKAFIRLLAEKGLSKISVAAITQTANINRSTFYEYYPDIRALLDDVESTLLSDLNTAVTFAMSGLIGVFTSWYAGGKQEPLEDIIHTTQKLLYAILQAPNCSVCHPEQQSLCSDTEYFSCLNPLRISFG
ncbi:MAG: TetR/AcrR family transcriptional regulator [Lachnospiraceae bacterium]|nr:TetR/AcrR family transcriptional regulator [Lachnospiraceae bacterium]